MRMMYDGPGLCYSFELSDFVLMTVRVNAGLLGDEVNMKAEEVGDRGEYGDLLRIYCKA